MELVTFDIMELKLTKLGLGSWWLRGIYNISGCLLSLNRWSRIVLALSLRRVRRVDVAKRVPF